MSEPVRMLDRPTVAPGNEVYDVPPVKPSLLQSIYENHRTSAVKDPLSSRFEQEMSQVQDEMRKDSGDELESRTLPARTLVPQSNYDFVPPPRRPSMEPEMESVYDVPPVKQQLVKPMVPERTYPASCIYDIPSALTNDESIYDIPPGPMPVEPPPGLDDAFVSKPLPASDSTDELAKSLEQISMRNAEKNFAEEQTQDSIYDVPPVLRKENPFSPSRPPVSSPQNAPPRPPKPPNLEGPPLDRGPLNPPIDFADEGFDDTYVGSPGVNDTSGLSNGHSAAGHQPAPQGHHWLNHTVPTPRKYLNVRDSSSSKPSSVPTSHPHPMPSPTGYLLMQGPNSPSNVFQYPDENYMTMEGSPEQAKRGPELYTAMNGNQPPPLPRMSTTSPVAVFSEEREEKEIFPPPVDRSSKPGRPKTGSSTTSIGSTKLASDSRGLSDSYYATDPDLGIPTRNSRTKSFSREGRHRLTNSPRGTPTMIRSNTVQYPSGSKPSLTHQSASVGEFSSSDIGEMSQDTYMLHENFIGERQSPDFPSSPRMKDKDKIEYLEIAHDEESATSPPPSKPSKDNNVEYITIDSEKTKALETIQQNREKSYKGS
ncbi:putative GRB2-associated-binding protein 1 isoform X2 [Apostichopus japonicus]|uniref:Putative GRB2-associated-binding protein 1 isoform X2 n=1 Tax=Stichopus japonicus TaxID=307972 RepID=A0A2G8KQW1_STIJA|nr:putative GRB2-associated-binding protein 1 isoform X2 [Apostichopus japonicus]